MSCKTEYFFSHYTSSAISNGLGTESLKEKMFNRKWRLPKESWIFSAKIAEAITRLSVKKGENSAAEKIGHDLQL